MVNTLTGLALVIIYLLFYIVKIKQPVYVYMYVREG